LLHRHDFSARRSAEQRGFYRIPIGGHHEDGRTRDDDLHVVAGRDGKWIATRKDGTPF